MLHPTLMKMPISEKRVDKISDMDAKVSNNHDNGRTKTDGDRRASFQDWYAKQDKAAKSDLGRGQPLPAGSEVLKKNNKVSDADKSVLIQKESIIVRNKADLEIDGKSEVSNEHAISESVLKEQANLHLASLFEKTMDEGEFVALTPGAESDGFSDKLGVGESVAKDSSALNLARSEFTVESESGDKQTGNLKTAIPVSTESSTDGLVDGNSIAKPLTETEVAALVDDVVSTDETMARVKPDNENIQKFTSDSDSTSVVSEDPEDKSILVQSTETLQNSGVDAEIDDTISVRPDIDLELEDDATEDTESSVAVSGSESDLSQGDNSQKDNPSEQTLPESKTLPDNPGEEDVAFISANKTAEVDSSKNSLNSGNSTDAKITIQGEASKVTPEGDRTSTSDRVKQFAGEQQMQMGQGEKVTVEQSSLRDSGNIDQDFRQQVLQRVEVAKKIVEIPVRQPVGHADWAKSIGDRMMMMVSRNMKVANIRLDPPNLGLMEVRISIGQDQQTQISFISQHAQVREVLEADSPRLRQMLEAQGLGQVDVDISDRKEHEPSMFGDGRGSQESGNETTDIESGEEIVEQVNLGLVDHYV